MKVLIACESSGVVREAFRRRGHNAWSCDLLPADDGSEFHIQGDVFANEETWGLVIAHPPCTYLRSSGLHWNTKDQERAAKTELALDFVHTLIQMVDIGQTRRLCIENPVGRIGTAIRKADQYIQPYQFGHDASKRTGLWLWNLPLLHPPLSEQWWVPPRIVNGKKRWANQTDSGQNRLGPSETRWKERSRTYEGIAEAMAEQWGSL